MSKKQVALFSTSFLQYSQTFVYDEIRFHQNYEIDVFCNERMNSSQFPYERVFCPPQNKVCQSLYRNIGYWPSFDRRFKQKKYNLVHAHFGTGAVYCLPYVRKYDIPFVVTFWGNDVSALMGSQRYLPSRWRYILKSSKILEETDTVLAVSKEMQQILQEYSGFYEKIKLYHHGVDVDKFQPKTQNNEGITDFLLVGRFTQKKGHIYALKAFKKVLDLYDDVFLSFVGSGELEAYCRSYVEQNSMSKNVNFLGVKPHDKVSDIIAQADVLLAPSIVADNHDREGSPTVVKEAGACGIPVIGSYHAGIWETINDGETGYLVPERDVDGLAQCMVNLIEEPALRKQMGENARARIEQKFNARKQVLKLEQFYDQIAQ